MSHIVDSALDDFVIKKEKEAVKTALANHKPTSILPFFLFVGLFAVLLGYSGGSIHNTPIDKTQLDKTKPNLIVEYIPAEKPPLDQTINKLQLVETKEVFGLITDEKGVSQSIGGKSVRDNLFEYIGNTGQKITKHEANKITNDSLREVESYLNPRKSRGTMFSPR
jgi:hypothetical protein